MNETSVSSRISTDWSIQFLTIYRLINRHRFLLIDYSEVFCMKSHVRQQIYVLFEDFLISSQQKKQNPAYFR